MDATENPKKTKLALKSFVLKEDNSTQLILAHKQLGENEHFVFTHGEKENDKLRCFRLEMVDGDNYHALEILNPNQIADVAQIMGINQQDA